MATIIFRIGEIHCIGCINRITSSLKSEGVIDAAIDFSTHIAKVLTEEENPDEMIYLQAIIDSGYDAEYLTTISEE